MEMNRTSGTLLDVLLGRTQGTQMTLPKPKVEKRKPQRCALCGRKELANGLCSCSNEAI